MDNGIPLYGHTIYNFNKGGLLESMGNSDQEIS